MKHSHIYLAFTLIMADVKKKRKKKKRKSKEEERGKGGGEFRATS